jgi:Skp family chaperone for outer membrane proteins
MKMSWVSDFLAGYSHGKNVDGFKKLEKKLEEIEEKIDSKNTTLSNDSHRKPSPKAVQKADEDLLWRRNFVLKQAHEELAKGNIEAYHSLLRDVEAFDRRLSQD